MRSRARASWHMSGLQRVSSWCDCADPAPAGGAGGAPVPRSELLAVVEAAVSRALSTWGRTADGSGE